ncbi:SufE family protein [Flaviflagellibacter deserti]|jgi:cysteine desulfuration protein SufE|uniref:SufE family protein n=1 Tax=Flaviflagellibacter deserti TaxID=2267266 RepID=A0ABV9Z0W9_9HYPH
MTIDDIIESFALIDDWEERYRYLIELGRDLPPFPEEARIPENKVEGCASQVWLDIHTDRSNGAPVLNFVGDSDAHLVKGLIAIMLALYSGQTAVKIRRTDALDVLDRLGLREHLTPQRSNGLRSMVARINSEAERALAVA